MIFERMIGSNMLRKVRQLESVSRASLLVNSCVSPQVGRTSTSLAGINRCLNSNIINNGNARFLTKLPSSVVVNKQLSRPSSSATGDHVRLWVLERAVAVALPIVIPAALMMENVVLDGVLSVLVVMHTHWGLEAMITDYARPSVVGPIVPKVLHFSLLLLSAVTLAGLFILIHDGPGVSKSIKNAWAIGKGKKSESPA